jgi:hypothetical protein
MGKKISVKINMPAVKRTLWPGRPMALNPSESKIKINEKLAAYMIRDFSFQAPNIITIVKMAVPKTRIIPTSFHSTADGRKLREISMSDMVPIEINNLVII